MLCYQPYCVSGVPYFPVLVKCGFHEEQGGGTVDCIQTINMSGISELLVSQRHGSAGAMSSDKHHHHPESLLELEELLEFPPQLLSEVEVDSRFQHLCKVIQKAWVCAFSSDRVGEEEREEEQEQEQEENNPFQELQVQLQKAKDRFHARVAAVGGGGNYDCNEKLVCGCRRLFKRTSTKSGWTNEHHQDVNPFREVRDALRMARRHFIPLIDQYISSRNNNERIHKNNDRKNNNNAVLGLRSEERQGSGGQWNEPTTTTTTGGDISHHAAANAEIQRAGSMMEKEYYYPKSGPIPIGCNSKEISSQTTETETGYVQLSRANSAADYCTTILAVNMTDDYSESCLPLNLCNCNKMEAASTITIVREAMDPPCNSSCFTGMTETNSNQSTVATRLGGLKPLELQRQREGSVKLVTKDHLDEGYQSMHPIVTNCTVELEAAGEFEQLSATCKELIEYDSKGCTSARSYQI